MDIYFQDAAGGWEAVLLHEHTDGVHHGTVDGLQEGCRYAFWPHGAPLPGGGAGQLLLDPYGRGIESDGGSCYSVYVGSGFDWDGDAPLRTEWRDTVVYECHVKGQTMLHPGIPPELRGTYAGLAHPVMLDYLTNLGITAVELLPVHFHTDEPHLQELGLSNYWGYNTLGFFAPHAGYATAAARVAGAKAVQDEFKSMVRALHAAGLEVILDVVYNHTAEGQEDQPALSFRGLADEIYYRHDANGYYLDTTGCGNTLDFSEPRVVQLALDSLRHWVSEYHIDGFRFDLAVSLCRDGRGHFNPAHPFLVTVGADRALTGVKLIAEPWDVGPGGWQTGRFPPGWADWNDRFRDSVRDFWLADRHPLNHGSPQGSVARLANAVSGSADLFGPSGRSSLASLNYVTAHDGFTLADLAAYDRKHNEDNGEENRDGQNDNRSYNHGVEGPTGDSRILDSRAHSARTMMATLLLSLGVPMITAGDEIGRTQHGNNNAYCQDSALSWVNWVLDDSQEQMLKTTRRLIKLRKSFLGHQPYSYPARADDAYLFWFNERGEPMTTDEWEDPATRVVQVLLGSPGGANDGLLVFNGSGGNRRITMPAARWRTGTGPAAEREMFELLFTSSEMGDRRRGARIRGGEHEMVGPWSVAAYKI
ncbi:glycogen debranching protein GlgX [Arthrobacter sp. I2-34]|uniref:Glycogen debranching protein GlgX n=1 Tax=Arthrobacter hankyongi TaxID=2904801 RepID=A0ABS9L8F4_9MICC|nr:glycogen debranching protein GlgX [Arthrobacter hankyongi]MCG2622958.1 glycogen debranching protein GlgX [Arthrobacter hankyongi]